MNIAGALFRVHVLYCTPFRLLPVMIGSLCCDVVTQTKRAAWPPVAS